MVDFQSPRAYNTIHNQRAIAIRAGKKGVFAMKQVLFCCMLSALLFGWACAAEKAAKPGDASDIEKEAEAQEKAANEPESPLQAAAKGRHDDRPGWVQLSDMKVLVGSIYTGLGKPLVIFDQDAKKYERVQWDDIATIEVSIAENTLEQDWRWKEGGSDQKLYTNLYYIWHKYQTSITMKDGNAIAGDVAAPLWVAPKEEGKTCRVTLHKRSKGEKAKRGAIKEPIYPQRIVFTDVEGADPPPEADETTDDEAEGDEQKAEGDDAGHEKNESSGEEKDAEE